MNGAFAKRDVDDLAIFGGAPLFSTVRPVGQLSSPDEALFFELARGIFDRRRLTNNGPLVRDLERRLADMHGVAHCIAFANATIALITVLKIVAGPVRGEVILPAFTYPGLPHIVRWAGHAPRFCDVDWETHALSPARAAEAISPSTRAILGVHQVNSPCAIDAFVALTRERAIPLVFDAVHGVGCTHRGIPIGGFGAAEVFSLHATKLLNGFEGGYVTTHDDRLAQSLARARNFGMVDDGVIEGLGLNGKLNEIHAAAALACVDGLEGLIERNFARYDAYRSAFAGIAGLRVLSYPQNGERWNYEFVLLEVGPAWPLNRDATISLMRSENVLARAYYSPPLHMSENHAPASSLPVTEALSHRFIQMAVGELLAIEDVWRIADFSRFLSANSEAIRARMADPPRTRP
ncbi:MAG TPA: aminotransferase class I/II-fold pyridoxal phosphate-dependent enzyme [Caulobacteraceae bacterium]|nr:aminotransferase class I/II-fold pyridoxal phosphate-dependent enzyme [Caulobacteraceae bacterium]